MRSSSTPETSVAVARRLFKRGTKAVRRYLKQVRRAPREVELVHRLRVSARRTVVTLDFFAPLFPHRRWKKLRQRLRHIRRMAGHVRDCDILREKEADNPTWLRRRRRQASQELTPYTAKAYRQRLKRQTRQLLRRAIGDGAFFAQFAQMQLHAIATAFWEADPTTLTDVAAVHRFRIRTKELRYSLEFIAEVCPLTINDELLQSMSHLQEALGQLNDAALYQQQLHERLSFVPHPADISALQRRIAIAYADTLQRREIFRLAWTDAARQQLRTQLTTLLNELGSG